MLLTTCAQPVACGGTSRAPAPLPTGILALNRLLPGRPGSRTWPLPERLPRRRSGSRPTPPHGHRTRTPDTGHRTPDTDTDTDTDTGHRTRGRWTRAPDTGRADSHARTLTEDADRAPKPPTPLGHRTMSLWAAHAALGNHDGSAVRPPCQCARLPTALPGSCSVAPPAANRRLGALLSCVGFGWYEGRAMALRKGEVCRVRLGGEC
jgi:hypothetical protein